MQAKTPIILVVEDEALVQVLVIEVLEERGYNVQAADTAEQALTLLQDHCRDVDVLLTDINLGSGDNGFALAHKAREICPDIRVIYVTGGVSGSDVSDRVAGSKLIPKPYELGHICEEIERALQSGGMRRA